MTIRKRISSYFAGEYCNPIIVVGMHRSGTTLLTRLLRRKGVNMGLNLSRNAESVFFQRLNKKVLNPLGASWRCVDYLPPPNEFENVLWKEMSESLSSTIKAQLVSSHIGYRSLVRGLLENDISWGWKDPRNTLVLPVWREIFPKSRIIHIYRDGRDCAVSLLKRELDVFCDKSINLENERQRNRLKGDFSLWESYLTRAFEAEEYFEKFSSVKFESLVKNPDKLLNSTLEKAGVNISHSLVSERIVEKKVLEKRFEGSRKKARDIIPSSDWLEKLGYTK